MDEQKENYTDSLEYLRARYSGKGGYTEKPADGASTPNAEAGDDLNELRSRYSGRRAGAGHRNALCLACEILLLCAVIVVSFTAAVWFAMPVTELGGETYRGGSLNLFSFLYGAEDSVYNQLVTGIEKIKNIGSDADGVGYLMKFMRAVFLGFCGIYILITMPVELIAAPVYFVKKNHSGLVKTAVRSVVNKYCVYVFFAFFGSVSGGVGIDSYYIGFKVGYGLTAGVFIGLALLAAASGLRFAEMRKTAIAPEKRGLVSSIVSGIICTAVAVAVTFMQLYSVFIYSYTSLLTVAGGAAVNGFRFKALVFPLLNILIFIACTVIYNKSAFGIKFSFIRLLCFGDAEMQYDFGKARKFRRARTGALVVIAVSAFVACIATFVLNIPSLGYGWSADIYTQLIAVFALSAAGAVCNLTVFGGKEKAA